MTNNAVYYDLAFYLSQNGFGSLGDRIFGGEWGEGISSLQILLLQGVGTPSEIKGLYENPAVQILVRGEKNQPDHEVYLEAKSVSDFLLSLPNSIEVNGTCYIGFEPVSSIVGLGKDENQRFIYSMNFSTYRNTFKE